MYLLAALLGALVGGAISLIVSTRAARTERRARYGESLLNALAAAERRLASATEPEHHGPVLLEPILPREDAIAVWACAFKESARIGSRRILRCSSLVVSVAALPSTRSLGRPRPAGEEGGDIRRAPLVHDAYVARPRPGLAEQAAPPARPVVNLSSAYIGLDGAARCGVPAGGAARCAGRGRHLTNGVDQGSTDPFYLSPSCFGKMP